MNKKPLGKKSLQKKSGKPATGSKKPKASSKAASEKSDVKQDKIPSLGQILGQADFLSDSDLEAFLEKEFGDDALLLSGVLDPLDEAQSLIYEAWNSQASEKVVLARRALDVSKDCADAYIILAEEEAKTLPAALALYRQALHAAERTLPSTIMETEAGKFWGIMETRPYMRARLGIAVCLQDMGKIAEAVDHMREMLRLNPNDNQGVRYLLIECLLKSGTDAEIEELLARYRKDASAWIRYSEALWTFRRLGAVKSAATSLAKAVSENPHVPGFLLKREKMPTQIPDRAEPGTREEAISYSVHGIEVWSGTPGALDWLSAKISDRR